MSTSSIDTQNTVGNPTAEQVEQEIAEYWATMEWIENYCEKENISDIADEIPF